MPLTLREDKEKLIQYEYATENNLKWKKYKS